MRTRRRNSTATTTLIDRRRTVRLAVEEFRGASKRMRQLKEGRQGAVVNPSLRLMHANHMTEVRNRLETLGHKKIARLLTQWHAYLMSARQAEGEGVRKERVRLAREVSRDIGRAIEEIR